MTVRAGQRNPSLRTAPRGAGRALLLLWPVLVLLALIPLRFSPILLRLELMSLDTRFQSRGTRAPATHDIVLVDIDDRTLHAPELSQWPFPRRHHAQVIRRLQQAGARLVALDLLFPERSGSREDDHVLAEAIRAAGNVYLSGELVPGAGLPAESGWRRFALGHSEGEPADPSTPQALALPQAELAAACAGLGVVNVREDRDNTLRRVRVASTFGGEVLPSLDLALARAWLGLRPEQIRLYWGRSLWLGQRRIQLNRRGEMMLDWVGPGLHTVTDSGSRSPFTHVSYLDLYRGKVPAEALAGKIVLVGWTVTGTGRLDHFNTPLDPRMPGVEVHATALENLLGSGSFDSATSAQHLLALALLVLVGALVMRRLPILAGLALTLLAAAAYWQFNDWLFLRHRLFLDLVAPELGLGAVFIGMAATRLASEERSLGIYRRAFEFYVAPQVLDKLVAAGEQVLSLNYAERREVTVLFADIREFVATSERLEAEDVIKLINEYFTDLGEILLRYDAYLDMFMGDCLMAVFNAFPGNDYPDHAIRAVRAALEMQAHTRRLREAADRRGDPSFDLCIGINSGSCVAGNLGSARQAHYTVIGDTVNLASRVERLCREYGTPLLVAPGTFEACGYYLQTDRSWEADVKGVTDSVTVREVVALQHADELPVF